MYNFDSGSNVCCSDYVDTTLQSVFNNETIVNCKAAKKVNNRLFNKKNCGWNKHGKTKIVIEFMVSVMHLYTI